MLNFRAMGISRRFLLPAAIAATAVLAAGSASAHVFFSVGVPFPFVYPAPVYVAPPPVYYAPPPAYGPPPAPAYYQEAPAPVAPPAGADYIAPNGQTCREYQTTIQVNGVLQRGYGTACLGADGIWHVTP
jgi:hypothetical protein